MDQHFPANSSAINNPANIEAIVKEEQQTLVCEIRQIANDAKQQLMTVIDRFKSVIDTNASNCAQAIESTLNDRDIKIQQDNTSKKETAIAQHKVGTKQSPASATIATVLNKTALPVVGRNKVEHTSSNTTSSSDPFRAGISQWNSEVNKWLQCMTDTFAQFPTPPTMTVSAKGDKLLNESRYFRQIVLRYKYY